MFRTPNDWFVTRDEKEVGPFSPAELKAQAARGKLALHDLVRRSDMTAPTTAGNIKELFQKTPAAAPPPLPSVTGAATPPPLPLAAGPTDDGDLTAADRGPTSGWKASMTKRRPDLSHSAKIGVAAGGSVAVLMFVCCGGFPLPAVIGSGPSANELSEDFCPFRKGAVQHTFGALDLKDGLSVKSKKQYVASKRRED